MKAFAQPLSKLQVEATRFMRSHELRLMHVVTDRGLHDAVVQLLFAQELRLDNRSPFVIFEQAHGKADPGWDLRAHAAREQHERRRTEMAENGEALGELPNAPQSSGLLSFAERLGQLLVVRPDQTEGLVVLLAPAYVEDQARWQTAIATLLSLDGLATVRWIIIDLGKGTIPGIVSKHERRTLSVRCVADGESPKAVLAEVMNEDLLHWSGPIGARPKGVVPPRRVDSPPPALPDPKASLQLAINRNVLQASVAMDEGRLPDAFRHQREARDLAAKAEMVEQSITMELMLGAYLMAAGAPDKAEETYRRAVLTAKRAELPDKVATAQIAIGSTKLARNDRPGALVAYADASVAAEQAGNPMLALEACRLTGDVANELHMDAQAIAFWSKAVKIGEQDPATAPLTGAGLAALNLALLCQERRQPRQAEMFLAKAHELTGVDPDLLKEEARKQAEERAQQVLKLEHPVKARPAELGQSPKPTEPSAEPQPAQPRSPVQLELQPTQPPSPVSPLDPELLEARRGVSGAPAMEATAKLTTADLPVEPARERRIPKEGSTERLTLSDLQALHWGADPVAPTASTHPQSAKTQRLQMVHRWSQDEQEKLRDATNKIVGEETTDLLSATELRALRGEVDLPDAKATPGVERTLRVDPRSLQSLRERHGKARQPPAKGTTGGTQSFSTEDLAKLRQEHQLEKERPNLMPLVRAGRTQRVEATDLGKLRGKPTAESGTETISEAVLEEPRHEAEPDLLSKKAEPVRTGKTQRVEVTDLGELRALRGKRTTERGTEVVSEVVLEKLRHGVDPPQPQTKAEAQQVSTAMPRELRDGPQTKPTEEANTQQPPSAADPDAPQPRARAKAKLGAERTLLVSPNELRKLREPASKEDGPPRESPAKPPVHAQKTERVSMSDLQALRKLADRKKKDEG